MKLIIFALPILPGKEEAWRRFYQELQGTRRLEFEASRRRLGVMQEEAWLTKGETGEIAILLLKGRDPDYLFERIATSSTPFDHWFCRRLLELHGVDLAYLPHALRSEQVFVWQVEDCGNQLGSSDL